MDYDQDNDYDDGYSNEYSHSFDISGELEGDEISFSFTMDLLCTEHGAPAHYGNPLGNDPGEPGHGPEFDLDCIYLHVSDVDNPKLKDLRLSGEQFSALFSEAVYLKHFEAACEKAAESGDFG